MEPTRKAYIYTKNVFLFKPKHLVQVSHFLSFWKYWIFISCSRNALKVLTKEPFLITSSIDRNLAISKFFLEVIGLTSVQLRNLVIEFPFVAMINIEVINSCWSVLTDIYGFSNAEARSLILKVPRLLSKSLLCDGRNRLRFFRQELGMQPPFVEAQRIILKFPQILVLRYVVILLYCEDRSCHPAPTSYAHLCNGCMSCDANSLDYFLLPNIRVLRGALKLTPVELGSIVRLLVLKALLLFTDITYPTLPPFYFLYYWHYRNTNCLR